MAKLHFAEKSPNDPSILCGNMRTKGFAWEMRLQRFTPYRHLHSCGEAVFFLQGDAKKRIKLYNAVVRIIFYSRICIGGKYDDFI